MPRRRRRPEKGSATAEKGSATEIMSPGGRPFCKGKVPLAECRVIKLGHGCADAATCGVLLATRTLQFVVFANCVVARAGEENHTPTRVVGHLPTFWTVR